MTPSHDRSHWESAQRAVIAGDVPALEHLLRDHPALFEKGQPPAYVPSGPGPRYTADAQAIIAHEHDFENYAAFADHVAAASRKDSSPARFEAAVEAVIAGDLATLQRLLREDPRLIHARSPRRHHATLLHYVGANGIEGFRQKTPPNAVAIAQTLLDAGAEIDAVADMYGGSTTLGLVATSIHPWLAGVQIPLLETLLQRGAAIDGPGDGSAVNACLANGRGEAAVFLAGRGARLDLEGAAGVGRLDLVQRYFDGDGRLHGATTAQQLSGFAWACEYGRTEVVEFLVQHGIALDAPLRSHGQTGLHWAAYGAHVGIVRVLLARGAPVNATEASFGGTPLGWTLYGWGERPPGSNREGYYEVVALLVAAGATVAPEWLDEDKRGIPLEQMLRADSRMLAALGPAMLGRNPRKWVRRSR
jgi:ankyrin repeat protein